MKLCSSLAIALMAMSTIAVAQSPAVAQSLFGGSTGCSSCGCSGGNCGSAAVPQFSSSATPVSTYRGVTTSYAQPTYASGTSSHGQSVASSYNQPVTQSYSQPAVVSYGQPVYNQPVYSQPSTGCSSCSGNTVSQYPTAYPQPSGSFSSSQGVPVNSSYAVPATINSSQIVAGTYTSSAPSTSWSTTSDSAPQTYAVANSGNVSSPTNYAGTYTSSVPTISTYQPSNSYSSVSSSTSQPVSSYASSGSGLAQSKASQAASMGLQGHLGGSLGGARYEGVGWSTRGPQDAVQRCCYWGQRPVSQIGVSQGSNGCWYACVLYR